MPRPGPLLAPAAALCLYAAALAGCASDPRAIEPAAATGPVAVLEGRTTAAPVPPVPTARAGNSPAPGSGAARDRMPAAAAAPTDAVRADAVPAGTVRAGPDPADPADPDPADPVPAGTAPIAGSAAPGRPDPGEHGYTLSGSASGGAGTVAPAMRLTVAADGTDPSGQLWTFDARTPDGFGVVEELALRWRPDGVFLARQRIDQIGRFGGLTLEFAPTEPVLFIPARVPSGRRWSFALESTDGCSTARVDGTVLRAAARPGELPRRLRLVAAVSPTGAPGCLPLSARRTQTVSFGPAAVPVRIDTVLSAAIAGTPAATARSTARLRDTR